MTKVCTSTTIQKTTLTLRTGIYYSYLDETSDAITFATQTSVTASSVRTSAAATITGLTPGITTTYTASGDATSRCDKNGDNNFQLTQTLGNTDTVRLRHTASATAGGSVVSTLTGGAITATFTSTTAVAAGTNEIDAANFDLELIFPRAHGTRPSTETVAGTSTPNVSANHPGLRCYPTLRKTWRVAYIGGSLPVTFSGTNLGTGMTINASTGEIDWPSPDVTCTPTFTIIDAMGTELSASPTFTVSTTGFKFVDGVSGNDTTGNGTKDLPWATFAKMKTSSSAGDITYFRNTNGSTVYTTGNITADNTGGSTGEFAPVGNWKRLEFNAATRSVSWRGYPGDAQVVIDGGYVQAVTQGNLIRIQGNATNPVCMEDIKFQNYYHIVLQIVTAGDHYEIFRNLEFYNVAQSIDGANSACIDSLSSAGAAPRFYPIYQDNYVHDCKTGGYKIYWQYKSTVDNCRFVDCGGNVNALTGRIVDFGAGGPDHKAVCGRFEVRYSTYSNHPPDGVYVGDTPQAGTVPDDNNGAHEDAGFGGNMNSGTVAAQIDTQGELRYCRLGHFDRPALRVVNMNNFGNGVTGGSTTYAGPIYIYRNTCVGRVNVENSDIGGPFTFYKNVIINDTGTAPNDRITVSGGNPAAGSRTAITVGTGADANITYSVAEAENIVIDETSFELMGDSRTTYLGKKGHEIP